MSSIHKERAWADDFELVVRELEFWKREAIKANPTLRGVFVVRPIPVISTPKQIQIKVAPKPDVVTPFKTNSARVQFFRKLLGE